MAPTVTQTTNDPRLLGKAYTIDHDSGTSLTYTNKDLKHVRELLQADVCYVLLPMRRATDLNA